MRVRGILVVILFPLVVLSGNIAQETTYTWEEIVDVSVKRVDQKHASPGEKKTKGLLDSATDANGQNYASVAKSQQIGIDLYKEAEGIQAQVLAEQAGQDDPKGCADRTVLTVGQNNMCTAADTLNTMAVTVIEGQQVYKDTAVVAYKTMEDTSVFPLNNSLAALFGTDDNGLPSKDNILYPSNKDAIFGFSKVYSSLKGTSNYKGLTYNLQKDYFYLQGKKYSVGVLNSKEQMIKAGINPSLANFIYKMLSKKSALAQSKLTALLKSKKLFDGRKWTIITGGESQDTASASISFENQQLQSGESAGTYEPQGYVGGSMQLSSSLAEEKTLSRSLNGIQVGLSSDNIFKIISRKYREKDKKGFFYEPSQK